MRLISINSTQCSELKQAAVTSDVYSASQTHVTTNNLPWKLIASGELALILGIVIGCLIAPNGSVLRQKDGECSPAVAQERAAATSQPRLAGVPAPAPPKPSSKPMSAWRQAYIATHGHEPPTKR